MSYDAAGYWRNAVASTRRTPVDQQGRTILRHPGPSAHWFV